MTFISINFLICTCKFIFDFIIQVLKDKVNKELVCVDQKSNYLFLLAIYAET